MVSRVKVNGKTIRDILRSSEMEADIQARLDRIAAAAGPGFKATVQVGRKRVRGSVITETRAARRAEAKDGALSKAIGAGR